MILISACLAGINCRYDGGNCKVDEVAAMMAEGKALPVCPEQLGGCNTPRTPCEIVKGNGADVLDGKSCVIGKNGEDFTLQFIKGAEEVLKIALKTNSKKAILRSGSPSCGLRKIYDGTFTGKKIEGNGVTAELLSRNGIEVVEVE